MKTHRSLPVILVVAAFAACGGGDATGPTVSSVVVTPSAATLDVVGGTVQFSARALDASGKEVTGEPVTWTVSSPSVATVSPAGLATALATGTAAVTATVDGVASAGVLAVTINSAPCDPPSTVSLAVGDYQSYPITTCLILPSGSNGDRYRVAVIRPTEVENAADVTDVKLTLTGLGVAAAPSADIVTPLQPSRGPLTPIPGLSLATLRKSLAVAQATEAFEGELRAQEEPLIRRMSASDLLPARSSRTLVRTADLVGASSAQALPDKLPFQPATPSDCTTGISTVTGILLYQNDDMAIYQDSTQRVTEPISEADAKRMTDYFSTYAKSMVEAYFGENPDIDDNGKEIVFASPVVTGNYAAWVWSGNYFSKTSCPASNERDMIYFNTDLIRAMDDAQPSWQALETVSHESKHIVSLYNRIAAGLRNFDSQPYHPLWIEEGTAEVSGNMSSRIAWAAKGGPPVGARVTRDDFVKSGVTPEDYGVLIRMARTIDYLSSQPNGLIVSPDGAGRGSSVYGSGWNFERWLGDAYGDAATSMADTALFHAMNDSLAAKGTAGLQEATGKPFSELFEEFVAAVCLEGTEAPRPERAFTSYDFRSATDVLQDPPPGMYPWPVTTTGTSTSSVITKSFASATYSGPIGATGIRIHDFVSNGTGTGARIQVDMAPPGRIIVVRIH